MLEELLAADASLHSWLLSVSYPVWLDWLMLAVSYLGTAAGVWLGLGIGLAIARPRLAPGVWRLALALSVTALMVDGVLKPWVSRDRPYVAAEDLRVIGARPPSYSFPSGHAASAAAGAFALSRIWVPARGALWALAVLIACSRVYLGVHYPLDVVAGSVLGLACAYFVTGGAIYDHRERRTTDN